MALNNEDKKDVAKHMGKALANKVSKSTKDSYMKKWSENKTGKPQSVSLKTYLANDKKVKESTKQFNEVYSKTSDAPDSPRAHQLMDNYRNSKYRK